MAIVATGSIQRGAGIRGALGRPNQVGEHWLGWTYLGDDNPMCGVYQRRPRAGGEIIVKMKHYHPVVPLTASVQNVRNTFSAAATAWNNLTQMQKDVYNNATYPKGLSGWSRFLREYMKANL